MVVSRPNINFRTEQTVTSDAEAKPYVGFEHLTEVPNGWEYNIKKWNSLFDLRLPTLPRLADMSTQGVRESEYFKSGVGDISTGDLYINEIQELFRNNERQWLPEVRNGWYYRYKTPYFLYSDNSRIQYIDATENRDSRNYLKLHVEPGMDTPVLAATLKRNPKTKTPDYYIKIKQVAQFSGVYIDGEEQETVSDAGKIYWDKVDFLKREFIIDNNIEGETSLYFNRDFTETHGVIPQTFQDLAACEVLGVSSGAPWQVYYLKYFPVLADTTFHLYVADSSTWVEWERVESWFDFINLTTVYEDQNRYYVDKDLGIVYLGSGQRGGVPNIGQQIVATYNSTLRVEYEENDIDTTISAIEADVNPITQHLNQGFVVITHDQLEPASIVLDINKRKIPFTANPTLYGPIDTGTDYAVLRATVKSTEGTLVPDILVGFTLSPTGVGTLDGGTESSSVTDGQGQAYSSYQSPLAADDLGFYSITVRPSTHPLYDDTGYKEVIIKQAEAGLEGQESELYLYQVLKDDILQGYHSVDEYIDHQIYIGELSIPPWVDGDSEKEQIWRDEITLKYDFRDWIGSDEFYSSGKLTGRNVVVYKLDPTGDSEYNGDNWNSQAIHPLGDQNDVVPIGDATSGLKQLGAVVPLRPELAEKITDASDEYFGMYRIIYPEDAIPDPEPDNISNTLGGYWLVGPRNVKFRAHCFSDFYNRIIYSNEITARISLPDYMLGEYLTPLLERVPYGWKIAEDTNSAAAALDGATFITINPHGTYNENDPWSQIFFGANRIFDVINGTINNNDEWASAPFQSVGFQFEIDPELWSADTAYSIGNIVKSSDGDTYICTTAGTSNSSEPTWNTISGTTTTDNTVVWTKD